MEIKRIIDKNTKKFLRDDSVFDQDTEEAINAPPVDAKYKARWNGEEWEEVGVRPEPHPQEPSLEERIQALEVMELERILGGGF